MEQNNWVTSQQVEGPSGVGASQNGGEYNYQDMIAFAAASCGAGAGDPASAAGAASAGSSQSGREKKGEKQRHSQKQINAMEA